MKASNNKSQPQDKSHKPKAISQKSQIDELTADLQRLQAEFINFKNRSEQEKSQIASFAKIQVVKELLPVIDDLERALSHLPYELKDNKWAQGTQKIHSRLTKQLEKLGISQIQALNQPFDPNLHEAISAEGDGDQQVVSDVLQNGYIIGDQVIRHVLVKILNK